ncbi:MAG: DUF979 domain-containing protein [Alphaproteobacteria bacterium]|nr:DUF979 domain-containing protein [Alphaproteobacteria bacterium]
MTALGLLYDLLGAMFLAFAVCEALHGAWRSAAFWGAFAVSMLAGSWLSDLLNGAIVILLAALALIGLRPKQAPTADLPTREASAATLGNRLFMPALVIPLVSVAGTLLFSKVPNITLLSLAAGAAAGLGWAMLLVRAGPGTAVDEGRRLVDAVGWAAVLPQALAALGGVFAAAGVGKVVADVATQYIPMSAPFMAVAVYCLGMALFTFTMGNAFAAFPVMTAGIGLPIIVGKFGGDPVVMSAIGMLSGFCGTLCTPMAANFNIVPVQVLDLKDRHAVIKVQAPTAFLLLAANVLLMTLLVFR